MGFATFIGCLGDVLPTRCLLGIPIHALTERECIDVILSRLRLGKGGWVVTPNLDILRRCVRDQAFREMVLKADLVVPDGMPLIWASRLSRSRLPERVPGSGLISTLSEAAARDGRSVFLLGGAPGTADAAAEILTLRSGALRVVGTHCPEVGFEARPQEMDELAARLRQASPDIVFVGLGSPKQEKLILRMRPVLPRAWWLGIGVSFSFLCGHVRRAPMWMQQFGLEWMHRLAQEPARLGRRYIIDGIPFAAHLFARSAWEGLQGGRTSDTKGVSGHRGTRVRS